ncbi:MAG: hypothetical protein AAGD07_19440 [Planctomycetota bacterium]
MRVREELTDMASWAPEFAADTDISEQRWIPIHQLSERLRLSIQAAPEDWGRSRRDLFIRLCQVSEDAWSSLPPDKRSNRFQAHDHDHEHGRGHDEVHGPADEIADQENK